MWVTPTTSMKNFIKKLLTEGMARLLATTLAVAVVEACRTGAAVRVYPASGIRRAAKSHCKKHI
jgi:hypothetical protein